MLDPPCGACPEDAASRPASWGASPGRPATPQLDLRTTPEDVLFGLDDSTNLKPRDHGVKYHARIIAVANLV